VRRRREDEVVVARREVPARLVGRQRAPGDGLAAEQRRVERSAVRMPGHGVVEAQAGIGAQREGARRRELARVEHAHGPARAHFRCEQAPGVVEALGVLLLLLGQRRQPPAVERQHERSAALGLDREQAVARVPGERGLDRDAVPGREDPHRLARRGQRPERGRGGGAQRDRAPLAAGAEQARGRAAGGRHPHPGRDPAPGPRRRVRGGAARPPRAERRARGRPGTARARRRRRRRAAPPRGARRVARAGERRPGAQARGDVQHAGEQQRRPQRADLREVDAEARR
jgi:hypothetical protein